LAVTTQSYLTEGKELLEIILVNIILWEKHAKDFIYTVAVNKSAAWPKILILGN
jgi:hypothetical protein